jgi:DNA-binding XRE family transcriptional regulator
MRKSGETKQVKKIVKKKNGRPKGSNKFDEKITANIELIKKYYRFGLTDKQVAELIDVSEKTLQNYKKDESFLHTLKKEKVFADVEVIASLYKRATGFEYDEVSTEGYPTIDENGKEKMKIKTVKKTKKFIAPDPVSMIYWLRNRQGWKDRMPNDIDLDIPKIPEFENMEDEQLLRIINS